MRHWSARIATGELRGPMPDRAFCMLLLQPFSHNINLVAAAQRGIQMAYRKRTLEMQADTIEAVLARNKVSARVKGGVVTPRFVQFHISTEVGAKVKQVTSLADEIALALGKREARIYRKGAAINVEVPRSQIEPVRLLPLCARLAAAPASYA